MPTIRVMLRPVVFAFAALGVGLPAAQAANPDALWHIVHDFCEPAAQGANVPQKCIDVESANGFAVLKDINGVAQYLLIPTARVTGIESPHDLMNPKFGAYGEMNKGWTGEDVKGFARIFGNQVSIFHKINDPDPNN